MDTRFGHLTLGMAMSWLLCAAPFGDDRQNTQKTDAPVSLEIGDAAPDFAFPMGVSKEGKANIKRLRDFRGKQNVLVAFYPKAFTSGCTKQLCGYRDDTEEFEQSDAQIIAVSVDEQEQSDRFRTEHRLPFPVVGDPERKIVRAYGVPASSSGYATRSVFLIDKQGKIAYIDRAYDVEKGKEPLYKALEKLRDNESKDQS